MKRKIYKELLSWKENNIEKPLMVIGARQIGKTYIINEFCKKEFKNYIYLNLLEEVNVVNIFKENISTQEKVDKLELLLDKKIDFENTIIFFDEVQESEEIISALKFFCENETKYKIICAGSLLGVKIHRFNSSFPVGKVKIINMYPMDFEEFLMANDQEKLIEEIYKCYKNNTPMIEPIHNKCFNLFRKYLCVGGMPETVKNLIKNNNDILLYDKTIIKDIITSYINDMNKYIINPFESAKIEAIYTSIPNQLGNNSNKFQYSKINKNARSRDYETALDWLLASSMIYKCSLVTLPEMPLKGFTKDDYFKLYLSDTGILCSMLDIKFNQVMLDNEFHYKGVLIENYVATELVNNKQNLYYWTSNNKAEVDFVLDHEDGIIPIEVKAGKNKFSPSIKLYKEKYNPKYVIKIMGTNFGFQDGIKTIPLYATFCIGK